MAGGGGEQGSVENAVSPSGPPLATRRSPLATRWGLLALLFGGLLLALVALPPSEERLPPLTVYSAAPTGGKGLWLWLEALGYRVSTLEETPYRVPDGVATVLILDPTGGFGRDELDQLEGWVRRGGTLVVAADGLRGGSLLGRFGVELRALPVVAETAVSLGQGGDGDAGVADAGIGEVAVTTREALVPPAGATPFLGDGERVFGALVPFGTGRVLALSAPAALSNRALRREANARLALALVGPAARGPLAFDELHHGYGVARQRSLLTLLTDFAWGRAALYAALLVFAYLALRGRRFGRPRPVVVDRGRSLAEYVTSLAALYRAGGKRAWAAEHFRGRLRRDLAGDLGLPADATDAAIATRARALGRDASATLGAIRALGRERLDERELLMLVRDGERGLAHAGNAPGRGRQAPSPRGGGLG